MNNRDCYYHDLEKMKQYEDVKYISKGKVDGKIIHNVLDNCNNYFHLEIQECSYDYKDFTNQEWVDIEGINYGWLWMQYKDDIQGQHNALAKKISWFMELIINKYYEDDIYYIHLETEEGECIRFYNQNNDGYVYNYRFSHGEIMF